MTGRARDRTSQSSRPRFSAPRGVRARLLLAMVIVTVLGAAAAAFSSTSSATSALLEATEDRLSAATADQIAAVVSELDNPPGQAEIEQLRSAVGPNSIVTYGQLHAVDGIGQMLVSEELVAAVGQGDSMLTERVVLDDEAWLVVGTPVVHTAPDGTRSPSGLEVYVAYDLADVQHQIDTLVWSAAATAALTIPAAVVLALLAARGVLRPVRQLRDTARRLSDGEFDARTPPHGADELAQLTATFNDMASSLQASMQRMERMEADAKRFAADVAHELRTPLATLTAVMEVLEASSDQMEPDARESALLAIAETRRLVQLAEDLLEVARIDAGTATVRIEEVELGAAIASTLRVRGWSASTQLSVDGEVWAWVDPRRLDVILANLVGNAHAHGVPPVNVEAARSGDDVIVTVTDHGPGLDPHVLPHVFDRFYKADAARSRSDGSGLGLAIAWENARLQGGHLTADAADHGGARFTLTLPAVEEVPV